jgi:hypothetical protein
MAGLVHRRAKARRSSVGYAIHVFVIARSEDVDARDKRGHDDSN